jgi:hypothetical protein
LSLVEVKVEPFPQVQTLIFVSKVPLNEISSHLTQAVPLK